MKNLIFFLTVVMLLASCKSTKQVVKSETEVKTKTELNTTKVDETKTDTKVISAIAENVTESDSTVIEETITELSKPDSLGNQHPEKITNRKIISGKNKETKVVENVELNQAVENKVSETENKVDEQELGNTTKIKTVKKFKSWKVVAGIVLLAGLVFLFLKFKHLIFKPKI